jgi:hypothetical protein
MTSTKHIHVGMEQETAQEIINYANSTCEEPSSYYNIPLQNAY